MHFQAVLAHAFGPFTGERLDFGPGLNVVHGANESGKSTWHAALYAGLCGMRRGGGLRSEDREFGVRHRPWEGDRWEAGAQITLADGRRIELRHDLERRSDCTATDMEFGGQVDVGGIINDGSPDGAQWLGLDRESFLNTACVSQSDLLGVIERGTSSKHRPRVDTLQEHLQRAAASAGTAETAAEALEALADFRKDHVGLDRINSRKPLRAALDRVSQAHDDLDEARERHQEYLSRQTDVEALATASDERADDLAILEAAVAAAIAEQAAADLARASRLDAQFPSGAPTPVTLDSALTGRVASVLSVWAQLPEPTEPTGEDLATLQRELDELDTPTPAPPPTVGAESEEQRPNGFGRLVGKLFAFLRSLLGRLFGSARPPVDDRRGDLARERAERRRTLMNHIETRRQQDEMRASAAAARAAAEQGLRDAAESAGASSGGGPDELVSSLEAWQKARRDQTGEHDRAHGDWAMLQRLLDGRTLDDLADAASELRERTQLLAAGHDAEALAALRRSAPDEADLQAARSAANDARDEWALARGELEELASGLPEVASAEDELVAAESERDRVTQLDATLASTVEFLKSAETAVNRDIAPALRDTLLQWLPTITNGRYVNVLVNPETLDVQVAGESGRWRTAELLSHGTAEQIYLLLRVAMARHLTRQDEVCPLILDDVLAACDSDRKTLLLETLLELSRETQVILFSHETEVLEWAEHNLRGAPDRVIMLDAAQVPA